MTLSKEALMQAADMFAREHGKRVIILTTESLNTDLGKRIAEGCMECDIELLIMDEMPQPEPEPRIVVVGTPWTSRLHAAIESLERDGLFTSAAIHDMMPARRGCHIHHEVGGRTSKGDRIRKRKQWRRK